MASVYSKEIGSIIKGSLKGLCLAFIEWFYYPRYVSREIENLREVR